MQLHALQCLPSNLAAAGESMRKEKFKRMNDPLIVFLSVKKNIIQLDFPQVNFRHVNCCLSQKINHL